MSKYNCRTVPGPDTERLLTFFYQAVTAPRVLRAPATRSSPATAAANPATSPVTALAAAATSAVVAAVKSATRSVCLYLYLLSQTMKLTRK